MDRNKEEFIDLLSELTEYFWYSERCLSLREEFTELLIVLSFWFRHHIWKGSIFEEFIDHFYTYYSINNFLVLLRTSTYLNLLIKAQSFLLYLFIFPGVIINLTVKLIVNYKY